MDSLQVLISNTTSYSHIRGGRMDANEFTFSDWDEDDNSEPDSEKELDFN